MNKFTLYYIYYMYMNFNLEDLCRTPSTAFIRRTKQWQ